MKTVFFQPVSHKNQERVDIQFGKDDLLYGITKTISHARWSQTYSCWHIPLTKQHCQLAYKMLAPHATINIEALEKYLYKRKQISDIKKASGQLAVIKPHTLQVYAITDNNMHELEKMVKTLQLKAYSKNTLELYRGELLILARLLGEAAVQDLTVPQITAYLLWLLKYQGYSEPKIHTTINALKFYFEQALLRPRFFVEIPRPKKPIKLPRFV